MPDLLDGNGLQIKSLSELITEIEDGLKAIYGDDINLESNSPDGQLVNIYGQAGIDIRELIQETYNSFNPDTATGRILDQRVAINNIQRKAGTYTNQPIEVTVDRTVALAGLDADFNNPDGVGYTVQDDSGTQFVLIDSQTLLAGTTEINFRAKEIGLVETTVGTITNQTTVVLGVTTLDNTSAPLSIGENEETDAQLRVRRQQSVSNASNGYLNGLLAEVLTVDAVTEARLFENVTNAVDADGIPAHGIWLIVEGGANSEIGGKIYEKKSYGCNMKGAVEVDITTTSGSVFTAKFDRPVSEDLHIRYDIQKSTPTAIFDLDAIKTDMVSSLTYNIGEVSETSGVTANARQSIINITGSVTGVPLNVEVSNDGSTWIDYLETSTKDSKFTLDETRITITVL